MKHGLAIQPIMPRTKWGRRGARAADMFGSFTINIAIHSVNLVFIILRTIVTGSILLKMRIASVLGNSAPTPPAGAAGNDQRFCPTKNDSGVRFRDIIGLQSAKDEIMQSMVLPMKHPRLANIFRIREGTGILLLGPPGNGKTLLAEAAANELNIPFFSISPADIMKGPPGSQESAVRALFTSIRQHKRAALFIDELEALAPSRGKNRSTIMARLIPQLLTETSGFHRNATSLLLMGATNMPWAIDRAFLRNGRFGISIYVPLPDPQSREEMIGISLQDRPVVDEIDIHGLVMLTEGMSLDNIEGAIDKAAKTAFNRAVRGSADDPKIMVEDILESISSFGKVPQEDVLAYERWISEFESSGKEESDGREGEQEKAEDVREEEKQQPEGMPGQA